MSALPRRLPGFSAVIHRRALATRPPQPDPPLSAATQDLLHRLAKDAARNTAPGATVRGGGKEAPYVGSVGPFNLGVGLGSNIRTKDWKKWRELGLGGKVVRMTTQTGNLTASTSLCARPFCAPP
ncbi:hypothetical protein QFC19_008048 [Naganishia cerealis]|uniref:Uncharacterized protein n=1 Tax=Naganishia cerealis TaxID=610337 RepID=A0ACC2V6C5_9TREE|nr:hypothetical protein QFC19_008048 [Naganishia cerealis]